MKSPFFLEKVAFLVVKSPFFIEKSPFFPEHNDPFFPPGLPVSHVLRQGEILGGIVERQRQRGAGGAGETPESCRRGCVFILDNIYYIYIEVIYLGKL